MAAPETGPLASAMALELAEPEFAAMATEFRDLRFPRSREWIDSGLEESMLLSAALLLPAGAGVVTKLERFILKYIRILHGS